MAPQKKLLFCLLVILSFLSESIATAESDKKYLFQIDKEKYFYSIKQTGDNYTFEFETNPGLESKKLKAAVNVLQSVYSDSSINPIYSQTFMKEGAMCFVFDGNLYSYRACFLPNDYSPENKNRFWGFVSRLPNLMWIITRNLIPAIVLFGLLFFFPKRHNRK